MQSIEKEYCSYAHEGNCSKEFLYYENMLKYKNAILSIKDICDKNICIDHNGYCPQILKISNIIQSVL